MGAEMMGPLMNIFGGVAGQIAGSSYWGDAQKAQKDALAAIANLNSPTDLSNLLQLQQYQNAGKLDPAMMSAPQQANSAAQGVQQNPQLFKDQMAALQQMGQLSQTGLNASDRLAMNQSRDSANADDVARQNSIMQSMRAQGMGGGGAELAARLSASQNASNSQNNANMQQAATASQRALQALSQYGSMSSNMSSQDFQNQMSKAQAADQMSRFNVQNQMSQNQYNTNALNNASQYNLANSQNVMNQNTQQNNQELAAQKQREQQQFQDQLNLGQVKAGAYNTAAKQDNDQGNTQAKQYSGMFQGGGQAAGGMAGMFGGGM